LKVIELNSISLFNCRIPFYVVQNIQFEPSRLKAFDQARYVLESLVKGETFGAISRKFNGDEQLVRMWILFLRHNHFMTTDKKGSVVATEKATLLKT